MGILERLLRQEWSKSHGISYSVLSEITTTHGRIEVSSGNSTCYPNTHCNSNPPAKIEGQPILFILHLSGNYTDLTTSPTPRGEAATPLFIDNITWQSAPFPKIMISATPVNSAAASRIINLGVDQEWARETNLTQPTPGIQTHRYFDHQLGYFIECSSLETRPACSWE